MTIDTSVYSTPGAFTYTVPEGSKKLDIIAIGAGSGGGSGRRGAQGSMRGGGAGASAGDVSIASFDPEQLPASLTVNVGAGGTGGAQKVSNNSDGRPGDQGGFSDVEIDGNVLLYAEAGNPGQGGRSSMVEGSPSAGEGLYAGGNGGDGMPGLGGDSIPPAAAPSGGAGGGGLSADNSSHDGGDAPLPTAYSNPYAFPAEGGGAPGGTGANGKTTDADLPDVWAPGGGGAGGASGDAEGSIAGGDGGGGVSGGGGGGGGGSTNGASSGAGGKGGDGLVVIISYS